jgi:hypothetical protein
MANHRESLTAAIVHLQTTRHNLINLLDRERGSEKAKQEVRKLLATIDAELSRLSDETDMAYLRK